MTPPKPTVKPGSVDPDGYDPCAAGRCDNLKERPNLELGAAVYVVFGIKDIDRSNISHQHVLTEKVNMIHDPQ